jgi:hypothetical protein
VASENQWRRCSACKGPIEFGSTYWVCNVSTCNRKRTGLVFCSVSCWEVHLPEANHRETWAVEKVAPGASEVAAAPKAAPAPAKQRRRIVHSEAPRRQQQDGPREVLIVASRLKDYVRARSGFNTSEGVLGPLSDIVRRVCDDAMKNAERAGRKTVLDRDIPSA